jgi:hypothetical protein
MNHTANSRAVHRVLSAGAFVLGVLLAFFPSAARAQFVGNVSPQSIDQTAFTNQSTVPAYFNVKDIGQTIHFVSYTTNGVQIDIRIEAAFLTGSPAACPGQGSTLWFPISQDDTDITSGTVVGSGYYPCVRVHLVSLQPGQVASAWYSGTSASYNPQPPAYNGSQQYAYTFVSGFLSSTATYGAYEDAPFAATGGTLFVVGSTSGGATISVTPEVGGKPAGSNELFTTTAITNSVESFSVSPEPGAQIGFGYSCSGSCSSDPSTDAISIILIFSPPAGTVSISGTINANVTEIGGAAVVADPCEEQARTSAVLNLTASGQIVTGTAGKQVYICSLQFVVNAADNVALVEGTGTTCGTSTAGMAGGATAATGWNLVSGGSVTGGTGANWYYRTATAADNVCLLVSSSAQISGNLSYVVQ